MGFAKRLLQEPPFRVIVQQLLKWSNTSAHRAARWELVRRPWYLLGLVAAAERAAKEHVTEFAAIKCGVAGGNGLLELQPYVESEFRVHIRVFVVPVAGYSKFRQYRDTHNSRLGLRS